MIKGIYVAAQSLHTKMRNMELISNNLANINTTGYKREIPFSEYLTRSQNKNLTQLTDFSEGALVATENPLDLAISGKGFFMIETERGKEFTKNGRFQISEEGMLVNEEGYRVLGEDGPINIMEAITKGNNEILVTKDGEIKVGDQLISKLLISKIENQEFMSRSGGQNFYFPDDDYIQAYEGEFDIKQGFIEESNTNAVLEMQRMIDLSKKFELSQKVITSLDEMMSKAKEIGRV